MGLLQEMAKAYGVPEEEIFKGAQFIDNFFTNSTPGTMAKDDIVKHILAQDHLMPVVKIQIALSIGLTLGEFRALRNVKRSSSN